MSFSSVQFSRSVMSDSLQSHRLWPTRLLFPRDSLGKNTGVGCRFLLQGMFLAQGWGPSLLCLLPWQAGSYHWTILEDRYSIRSVQFRSVAQSCSTLCDPMNCSTPGLPVHHQLPEFTETHVHRVSDAIQPSHPLSSPSPLPLNPSQHQSLFQ